MKPLLFLALIALPVTAQTDARPQLNGALRLADAVQFGLQNSPVIRGGQIEIDAATAQIAAARAARKPSLSATTFLTAGSENGPIFNTPDGLSPQNLFAVPRGPFFNQNLMLMLPLSTGGRLRALENQARAARDASAFDHETMRLDLALEIKTDYRQALLAREMARVAQNRQDATAERLKNDRAAFEAGRVPQLNVLRDEAEVADAAQEQTNASRDFEMALVMLRTALGAAPTSSFTLEDSLEIAPVVAASASPVLALPTAPQNAPVAPQNAPVAPQNAPVAPPNAPLAMPEMASPTAPLIASQNLLEQAIQTRPELKAARNRLENARQGLAATTGTSRPQIALQAMADLSRARNNSSSGIGFGGGASVGVVVGVPIFDGGLRRADRASASASIARAQAEIERIELQIEREVSLAQLSLSAAQKNIKTAQSSVAAAQEAYRVAGLRAESGRGTAAETLDALAALTRASGNRARALYEAQSAADQLNRALGVL